MGLTNNLHKLFKIRKPPKPKLKVAEVEKELSKIPKLKSKAAEVEKEKRVIVQVLRKEPDLPTKIQKPKSSQTLRENNNKHENTTPALTTCRLVRIIPRRLSTIKPVA